MHIHMYACIPIHICVYIYIHVCICMCICTPMYIHMYAPKEASEGPASYAIKTWPGDASVQLFEHLALIKHRMRMSHGQKS